MLFVLVKNNFKLLIRDKISMFFLILLPILLIIVLSSAFSTLLNTSYKIKSFNVGYTVESGSNIEKHFPAFIKSFEANNIKLISMDEQDALKKIKNGNLTAYLKINDKKYSIYKKDGLDVNAMIFENTMNAGMYFYDGNNALINYLKKNAVKAYQNNAHENYNNDFIKFQTLKTDPVPSSTVYYGIVEIAYIIWFGMISITVVISNERKYGIDNRMGLTSASSFTLFLGKLIPTILTITMQVGIAAIISTILMDIKWGSHLQLSILILLLEIIATSAAGILLSLLFKNQALVNVIIFLSSFFFGFVGGSFQTYMYNFVSEKLSNLSPLYYINRALVELSTKGYNNYINSSILILICISFVAIALGVLTTAKRRQA